MTCKMSNDYNKFVEQLREIFYRFVMVKAANMYNSINLSYFTQFTLILGESVKYLS